MAMYMVPRFPFVIYATNEDSQALHRTASNTGREAQAYVQFIIDYYDCLPQVSLLITCQFRASFSALSVTFLL